MQTLPLGDKELKSAWILTNYTKIKKYFFEKNALTYFDKIYKKFYKFLQMISDEQSLEFTWCQCYKTFYSSNLLPLHSTTIILYYKIILL
jgi:hypothetical protein